MRIFPKHPFQVFCIIASIFLVYASMLYFDSQFLPVAAAPVVPAWDFQDHTVNHANLTTLSSSQIVEQLTSVDAAFQLHGLPAPKHVAYPTGAYNAQVISVVSQYRLSGRLATSQGRSAETYPVQNWYTLSAVPLVASTTLDRIKSLIDDAVQKKGLMSLFSHSVLSPPDGNGISPTLLSQILDYLVAQQDAGKLSILTMSQAYTQYNGQKAVVVVSFDDGWYTDYTVVWPMFKARGIAGTSYIIINNVNSNVAARLNWVQVREMAQADKPSGWSVKVNSDPLAGGITNPSGTTSNIQGSLSVTATPATGNLFSNWLFDETLLTSNPVTLPAQATGTSHTLTAYFVPAPTPTPMPTPSPTPEPTPSPTPVPTPISTPTLSPTPTATPTPTPESTPSPTYPPPTPSPYLTPTPTPIPTPTPFSSTPTPKPSTVPTISPTATPSLTPYQSPQQTDPTIPSFTTAPPEATSKPSFSPKSQNISTTPKMPILYNQPAAMPIEVIVAVVSAVITLLIITAFFVYNRHSSRR